METVSEGHVNATLYKTLEAQIQCWLESSCEEAGWPRVIVGTRTVEQMARAARAVFDGIEESQDYARREGLLNDA